MKKKKAFSLIEALVAVAILSIIVISLLPAIHNSIIMAGKTKVLGDDYLNKQYIIESYKSYYFSNGPFPNDKSCRIEEKDKGSMVLVSFYFDDEEKSIDLYLPKDKSLYGGGEDE